MPRVLEVGFGFEHSVIDAFLALGADVTACDILFEARIRLAFSHKHAVDAGKLHVGREVVDDTPLEGKYNIVIFNMPSPYGEMHKRYIDIAVRRTDAGGYLVLQTERPELFIEPFKRPAGDWEEVFIGNMNGKRILPSQYVGKEEPVFAIFMRRSREEVDKDILKDPLTPAYTLASAFQAMNLFGIYNVLMGHEATEQAKTSAREQIRIKFRRSSAEDCAEFVIKTEGRCLQYLIGEKFTDETTAVLCKRNYASILLIRNLSIFAALPPALIRHLLRQVIVKKNREIRLMLTHHQNCPSDARNV